MECKEKHTPYQPSNQEFNCPKCGAKVGDFAIDSSVAPDCEKLHMYDEILCYNCKHSCDGKGFANQARKKAKAIKCPACKGKGFVTDSKAQKGGPQK